MIELLLLFVIFTYAEKYLLLKDGIEIKVFLLEKEIQIDGVNTMFKVINNELMICSRNKDSSVDCQRKDTIDQNLDKLSNELPKHFAYIQTKQNCDDNNFNSFSLLTEECQQRKTTIDRKQRRDPFEGEEFVGLDPDYDEILDDEFRGHPSLRYKFIGTNEPEKVVIEYYNTEKCIGEAVEILYIGDCNVCTNDKMLICEVYETK